MQQNLLQKFPEFPHYFIPTHAGNFFSPTNQNYYDIDEIEIIDEIPPVIFIKAYDGINGKLIDIYVKPTFSH